MKKAITILVIILIVLVTNFMLRNDKEPQVSQETERSEMCFMRIGGEEYDTEEYMKLIIVGSEVYGTKFGTQLGPNMSNGYLGVLNGTKDGNDLVIDFAYTIEGSNNTEREEYKLSGDSLLKQRYALKEEGSILVPDKTSDKKVQEYGPITCEEFSSKLPR